MQTGPVTASPRLRQPCHRRHNSRARSDDSHRQGRRAMRRI